MSTLDWLPTIATLTGSPYAQNMYEGEDVSDIWLGAKRARTNLMFWKFGGQTVVQGNWKLTDAGAGTQLFDLSVDAAENFQCLRSTLTFTINLIR